MQEMERRKDRQGEIKSLMADKVENDNKPVSFP